MTHMFGKPLHNNYLDLDAIFNFVEQGVTPVSTKECKDGYSMVDGKLTLVKKDVSEVKGDAESDKTRRYDMLVRLIESLDSGVDEELMDEVTQLKLNTLIANGFINEIIYEDKAE